MRRIGTIIVVILSVISPFVLGAEKVVNVAHVFDLTRGDGKNIELPTDVAVNNSYIYVLDGLNDRVLAFSHDGNFAFSFGDKLEHGPLLNKPVGIYATESNIFIADTGNHLVRIYDLRGHQQTNFSVRNGEKIERPIDVILNRSNNRIYVTCNLGHRVQVYTRDGKYISRWGKKGTGKGLFQYPATIANLGNNKIVVDVFNARAQVFSDEGKFIRQVGSQGVVAGKLFRPKGVAVDAKKRIYISDSFMNVVQVFDQYGKYLHLLGTNRQIKRFTGPVGMSIHRNRIFITESLGNKVSVYKLN